MFKRYGRWLVLFLLSLFLIVEIPPILSQNTPTILTWDQVQQLVEASKNDYETENYSEAINKLTQAIAFFETKQDRENLAISLTNLGRIQLTSGQATSALTTWEKAREIYNSLKDGVGVSNTLILEAQAMEKLGLSFRGCNTLTTALNFDLQNTESTDNNIREKTSNNLTTLCQENEINSEEIEGTIDEVIKYFQNQPLSQYLDGLHNLGEVLRTIGKLEESEIVLEKTLQVTKITPKIKGAILISLGNTLRAKGNLERDREADIKYNYLPWRCDPIIVSNYEKEDLKNSIYRDYNRALKQYEKAAKLGISKIKIQANLNRLSLVLDKSLLLDKKDVFELQKKELKSEIKAVFNSIDLDELETNLKGQGKIYAILNYAKSSACLRQIYPEDSTNNSQEIINLLDKAIKYATKFNNNRAKSYAIGSLGGFYEYLNSLEKKQIGIFIEDDLLNQSFRLTEKALFLTQPQEAPDLAYQWQWQLGRLFEVKGNKKEAIKSYQEAAKTLELARNDIISINSDVQFSFRDNIEPVYRELVKLLLQTNKNGKISQQNLKLAIENIDSLQLAELENFLRCDLSTLQRRKFNFTLNEINSQTAFIFTIKLENSLEIILSLPGENLTYYHNTLPKEFDEILQEFRKSFSDEFNLDGNLFFSKEVYPKIISSELNKKLIEFDNNHQQKIKTLVFILDGQLQNIPMATLYDGEKYLIEKYAVATIPSFSLLKSEPRQLKNLTILTAGLAQKAPSFEGTNFQPLRLTNEQLEGINLLLPKKTRTLVDDGFSSTNIQKEFKNSSFPIVHLITHGNFSSNPKETFILTWNKILNISKLKQLLQNQTSNSFESLELLVISACETAKGDKRAALGLAGVAIQSGARSTIASLWKVDEGPTKDFMIEFYDKLRKENLSLAEAIRQVQISFLKNEKYQHPKYWGAFVIVGNWL